MSLPLSVNTPPKSGPKRNLRSAFLLLSDFQTEQDSLKSRENCPGKRVVSQPLLGVQERARALTRHETSRRLTQEKTEERPTSNRCNSIHSSNETSIHRTLHQRNGVRDNDQSPGEDTRASNTSNGAPNDQSDRIRRNTTNKTSELEDSNSDKVDPFNVEEGVEFAKEQLE